MEIQILECFSTSSLPRYNIRSSSSYTMTTTTSLLSKQKTAPPLVATTTNKIRRPLISSSLANNILNTLDALVCRFLDRRPLHPDSDPENSMSENYSPVDELPPTPCPVVVGPLPPSLHGGAYIRIGPNPQFFPTGPHHVLDGDGMLHVIRISAGGRATFCSRYVKTHKYETERHLGNSVVPNFVGAFNGLAATLARSALFAARILLARQLDPVGKGAGVGNTSIAVLAGGRKLLALCESDLPYEIQLTDDGDVKTLGRHDFESIETAFVRMTAHPKVDRETGVTFAFRYAFLFRPFLTFHRIDRDGRKEKDVPIYSKNDCSIMHDFGLTENHAVFPDIQLAINPRWIFARDRGTPLGIDLRKTPRLGVIPREAEDECGMRWVDSPGLNMVHCMNAWEEEDDTIQMVVTNVLNPEYFLSQTGLSETVLEKVTIDLKTKSVTRRRLSLPGRCNEFGTINPAYASKKVRYVYVGVLESKSVTGVEKFDLSLIDDMSCTVVVASRMYGSRCYGGEPFFVAREPNNPMADEDDGYLLAYVHDENTQESRFIVMDAKSPDLEIIAAIKLPQRVPSGFHGLFISETELSKLGKY